MRVTLVWHLGFLTGERSRLKVLESPANQDSILFVFTSRVWAILGRNYNAPDCLELSSVCFADCPSVDVGVGHQYQASARDRQACAGVFGNAADRHAVIKSPQ
jgi:hypothetical protein